MQQHLPIIFAVLLLSVAFHEVNSSDETIKARDSTFKGFGLKDILGDDRLPKLTVNVLNAILKENGNIPESDLETPKDPEVDLNHEGIVKR